MMAIDEPQPPYGLSYTSPAPPLFATPFHDGVERPVPRQSVSAHVSSAERHSQPSQRAASILRSIIPQAGMTAPAPWNTYPYNENYFFSIERQINESTLFSVSYVGSQAHHLLVGVFRESRQPGALPGFESSRAQSRRDRRPAGRSAKTRFTPLPPARPFNGTRAGLGPDFANDDYDASVGNSNYNSFQVSLRHSAKRLNFSLGYTYSKSIDQASSISDPLNPFNFSATRALSAFDLKQTSWPAISTSFRWIVSRSRCEVSDAGMGDFGNHARHFGFPGDAARATATILCREAFPTASTTTVSICRTITGCRSN